MIGFLLLSTLFVLTLVFLLRRKPKKLYKLPPGPQGWPILGNLPQILKNSHLKLSEYAQKYGPLYTIHFGSVPALVVTDAKLLKQIFGHSASTGKFKTDTILLISQGPYGIISSEGQQWSEQRQFCTKNLKQFGFGKGSELEPRILVEVDNLCAWIENEVKLNGKVVLNKILNQATNNTLWTMVSGQRIEITDSKIAKIMERYVKALLYTTKTGLVFFPWLKYIAPGLSGYTELDNACKVLHEFVKEHFASHQETMVEGSPPRDLMDSYLEHLKMVERNENSSFYGDLGKRNTVAAVVELFVAGAESMSVVLNWLVFYMAYYQDVQRKLQKEIDKTIGFDRQPSLSDKSRMPYTEAVILEILRISSMTPLGIIHRLNENINFEDYVLPMDTLLIPNLYGIHHDNDTWGDPEIFRPERFIEKGSRDMRDFFVGFQPGRRSCLGEPLAKDVLFIFVSRLFQKFNVSPCADVSKETYFEAEVGIILVPKPVGVVMETRQ